MRWHKIFEGGFKKKKFIFEALALEAVSVVVLVIPKLFVEGTKVSNLQGTNKLAANG